MGLAFATGLLAFCISCLHKSCFARTNYSAPAALLLLVLADICFAYMLIASAPYTALVTPVPSQKGEGAVIKLVKCCEPFAGAGCKDCCCMARTSPFSLVSAFYYIQYIYKFTGFSIIHCWLVDHCICTCQ